MELFFHLLLSLIWRNDFTLTDSTNNLHDSLCFMLRGHKTTLRLRYSCQWHHLSLRSKPFDGWLVWIDGLICILIVLDFADQFQLFSGKLQRFTSVLIQKTGPSFGQFNLF